MTRAKGQGQENLGEWLEGELRDTKARLHKVESELEQSLKHVWSLEADIRKLGEAAASASSAASEIAGFRGELRQVNAQLSRLQDRNSALATRAEEVLRNRQSDSGRDKQELGSLMKQIEGVGRSVEQYEARLHAVEEAVRKVEEDVAGARLSGQALERNLEEVAGRGARIIESSVRIEQDISRMAGVIDSLRKADDALDDRVRLLLEQLRHVSDRLSKVDDIAPFPEEARELLQRARVERDQLAQRIALGEKLNGELAERLQQLTHGLSRQEQRQQVQNAQLLDLAGQVQETAERLQAQTKRFFQILLRQRRRQMDTLAQEIKELGQGDPHATQ